MTAALPETGPGSGPTVLRVLLGGQLRKLREAKGITREAAGDAIRGSHAVAARRLDRKDAALGAASAAVALVGTAAIMRRRRRKGSTA